MTETSKNFKPVVIVLGVVSGLLLVALLYNKQQASEQVKREQSVSVRLSNQVQAAAADLEGHKLIITNLVADLNVLKSDIQGMSNNLSLAIVNLAKTQDALQSARSELGERNQTVVQLEDGNRKLVDQTKSLESINSSLDAKVADLNQRLTEVEGDKEALTKELKRLTAEKADLEMQFNDLEILRARVKKIRHDQVVAQRLVYAKRGLLPDIEVKGAQRQTQYDAATAKAVGKTYISPYSLNVEVGSDGSVKAIQPLKRPVSAK